MRKAASSLPKSKPRPKGKGVTTRVGPLTFGPKPQDWKRLKDLGHALHTAQVGQPGQIVLSLAGTIVDLTDVRELGRKLKQFSLGGDAQLIFGKEEGTGGRPSLRVETLNYVAEYWRQIALGESIEHALNFARSHYEGFEAPSRETLKRYTRDFRDEVFELLEAQGVDLTKVKAHLIRHSHKGDFEED